MFRFECDEYETNSQRRGQRRVEQFLLAISKRADASPTHLMDSATVSDDPDYLLNEDENIVWVVDLRRLNLLKDYTNSTIQYQNEKCGPHKRTLQVISMEWRDHVHSLCSCWDRGKEVETVANILDGWEHARAVTQLKNSFLRSESLRKPLAVAGTHIRSYKLPMSFDPTMRPTSFYELPCERQECINVCIGYNSALRCGTFMFHQNPKEFQAVKYCRSTIESLCQH